MRKAREPENGANRRSNMNNSSRNEHKSNTTRQWIVIEFREVLNHVPDQNNCLLAMSVISTFYPSPPEKQH